MRNYWVLILYIVTCTALLSEGLPDDYLRKREAIHNQQSETANLNAQNDVLSDSSSLETTSPHGSTIKVGDNSTLDLKVFCPMCVCRRPFHEKCLLLCCNSTNSNKISPLELLNPRETVTHSDPATLSLSKAIKGDHAIQGGQQDDVNHTRTASKATNGNHENDANEANHNHQLNDVSHTRPGSKATNGHHENDANEASHDHQLNVGGYNLGRNTDRKETIKSQADAKFRDESQARTERPESGIPFPSKPTISDLDANSVKIPDPVAISTNDDSVNMLWVIFILLSLTALISVLFIFIKQWRLRKRRELYLTRGLNRDVRPSSLIDIIMNDHSD